MRRDYARRLVVMVKEPRAGAVKTRLAKGTGTTFAVRFYRHATAAVLARVRSPSEWQTILAVSPDTAVASRAWRDAAARRSGQIPSAPGERARARACLTRSGLAIVPQGPGDLGQRMQRLMDRLPPGPVVIIGSDIPGIRAPLIRQAFHALGRNDAVFGPSSDGGYWLVGFKRFPAVPRPFGRVRWSTAHALSDTLASLDGLAVLRIATLDDVDEAADLDRAAHLAGRRI